MHENDPSIEETAPYEPPASGTFRAASSGNEHLLGGRYEVQEEIGAGSFSITWRGLDRRLGRTVAIKILRREYALDPTYVQRFEREARTAASVSHQNVVDVYDYGQHGELLYIVMQYIEGEDLRHLIAREGPLPLKRAAQITRDVLSGLAAIHEAGIIHRDIKPQNILIGLHGRARVADFGVARVVDDGRLTSIGTTVGSASYMAPEQAQGGELTPATDLYAVGVVLHEMLTGRLPFEAPTTMALLLAHIQTTPQPPSHAAPGLGIPPSLDRIVMRALAKQPHDRFASAAIMRRELAAAMDEADAHGMMTQALTAVQPGPQARPSRPAAAIPLPVDDAGWRRSPNLSRRLALALLLAVLMAIGALAGTWAVLDKDNDDPGTEIAQAPLIAVASPTATTSAPVATKDTAPVDLAFSPTEPTLPATDAPPETPEPTLAPTETPVPTQAPTETPVPTETPEPTHPPTEPVNPIEPIGAPAEDASTGGDLSVVDGQGNTDQIQRVGDDTAAPTVSGGQQTETVATDFAASDWQGAYYQATGNLQPWSAIYGQGSGYESGTLRVELPAAPASGTITLTVQGMTSENWSSLPMAIRVNGQEVFSGNSPFPTWNGVEGQQPWTTVSFELPAEAFQQGENTITFVNLAEGGFGLPPYILLASGTLTEGISGTDTSAAGLILIPR